MPKRRKLPEDEAKVRYAAVTAMNSIDRRIAEFKIPILILFASPLDGFANAEVVVPTDFPTQTTIDILEQALQHMKLRACTSESEPH